MSNPTSFGGTIEQHIWKIVSEIKKSLYVANLMMIGGGGENEANVDRLKNKTTEFFANATFTSHKWPCNALVSWSGGHFVVVDIQSKAELRNKIQNLRELERDQPQMNLQPNNSWVQRHYPVCLPDSHPFARLPVNIVTEAYQRTLREGMGGCVM